MNPSGFPDAVITLDGQARVLSLNPAGEAMFQCQAAQIQGQPIDRWVQGAWRVAGPAPWDATADARPQVHQAVCIRSDGSSFPAELSASHEPRVLFIRDCSNLRRLEREVLETGEALRRKFGQDLHDGLGQLLTGIAFLTQGLVAEVPFELRPRLERLTKLVNDAVRRTQEITEGMAPLLHDSRSLDERLTDLARATSDTFAVRCTVDVGADFSDLDLESRFHLFMIAQEAVTNSVRHAACQNIEIALWRESHRRFLRVRDDGKPLTNPFRPHGLGIRGMEYRSRLLGGQFHLQARAEGGLDVRCEW